MDYFVKLPFPVVSLIRRLYNIFFFFLVADESEVEQIAAARCSPPRFPSPSSVTSQPTPRTDPLLHKAHQTFPTAAAGEPLTPSPEAEQPKPSPSNEEEEEGAQGAKETKQRTLLEIDRFTLCGNRID